MDICRHQSVHEHTGRWFPAFHIPVACRWQMDGSVFVLAARSLDDRRKLWESCISVWTDTTGPGRHTLCSGLQDTAHRARQRPQAKNIYIYRMFCLNVPQSCQLVMPNNLMYQMGSFTVSFSVNKKFNCHFQSLFRVIAWGSGKLCPNKYH